jgi:hypothetical protein
MSTRWLDGVVVTALRIIAVKSGRPGNSSALLFGLGCEVVLDACLDATLQLLLREYRVFGRGGELESGAFLDVVGGRRQRG